MSDISSPDSSEYPESKSDQIFPLTLNNLQDLVEYSPNATNPSALLSKVSLPAGAQFTSITSAIDTNEKRWSSVQIGKNKHIELNSALQFLNHSCSPTLELDTSKLELRVAREGDLNVGDELTFFYPSTEWEMASPFRCVCRSKNECLGMISGASTMGPKQLKDGGYFLNEHIREMMTANPTG